MDLVLSHEKGFTSVWQIIKNPVETTGFFVLLERALRQGAIDGAKRVADLGTKQTHDSNHHDSDEREDNRVLDEALAFFFGCKQHGIISFLKNGSTGDRPQSYA
jgi:hypothetical protein